VEIDRPEIRRAPLVHEGVFAAFLVLIVARLALVEGPGGPHTLAFAALLAALAGVVLTAPPRWRLLFVPFALQIAYFLLGPAMAALHVRKVDLLLQQLDDRVLGLNLSVALEPWTHPLLTDAMSACYLLFFPYLIVAHLDYFRGNLPTLRRFCVGLYTIYAAGLIGYALLPAAGPYVAMADRFRAPLGGGALTRVHHEIVVRGTNGVDVFPSLHCAVTCFLLFFDARHAPRRCRWLVLPVIGLWISTVYLRYHYFVDVAAGFALAGLGLAIGRRRPEVENP
jgi:hypothetical protein